MDCSTCRSLFSTSFDGRLAGERRQEFTIHVQHCAPCESEFALYRRVFSAVRGLPDGEAPPFKAPSEVPGSLSTANRFTARPRFARAAAGILILIGLVGTHVAVFQWSRDRASARLPAAPPSQVGGASIPVAQVDPATLLPASARDHLEATDLFLKTAAQVPDSAGERGLDLVRADWEASGIPERTQKLRGQIAKLPAAQRAAMDRYLDTVQEFCEPMQKLLVRGASGTSLRRVRAVAALNRVGCEIETIRPMVACLPRGQSYKACTMHLANALTDDGRLILTSKIARLAGNFDEAIAGFEKFSKSQEFMKSPLRSPGLYLLADAYLAVDRYSDGYNTLKQSNCIQTSSLPNDNVGRWLIVIRGNGGESIEIRAGQGCFKTVFRFVEPMIGSEGFALKSEWTQPRPAPSPVEPAPDPK